MRAGGSAPSCTPATWGVSQLRRQAGEHAKQTLLSTHRAGGRWWRWVGRVSPTACGPHRHVRERPPLGPPVGMRQRVERWDAVVPGAYTTCFGCMGAKLSQAMLAAQHASAAAPMSIQPALFG